MNSFKCNSQIVLEYLLERIGKTTPYWLAHSCFKQLEEYLVSNGVSYSNEIVTKWLSIQVKSKGAMLSFSKALRQLQDVYEVGHVRFINRTGIKLKASFEKIISSYMSYVSDKYTDSHQKNILFRCRFFFGFIQMDCACSDPSELTYEDLQTFCCESLVNLSKADFSMYKGTITNLLFWMSEQGMCPIGFAIFLSLPKIEKAVFINELPMSVQDDIRNIESLSNKVFSSDKFLEMSKVFCEKLGQFGYADTMMNSAKATMKLLFLFLDMNGLHYDPASALIWFQVQGIACFGSNKKMSRRILSLFEVYAKEGAIHPEEIFVYRPLLSDFLPEWCRTALVKFLDQKKREKKASSTVCMYRSSVTRLCQFLVDEGITSFSQIDASHLKKFNLTDLHETAEGKNAYNVRIRKFLFFLAENGYIENHFLGQSLSCVAAPKTRVVKVLNSKEKQALKDMTYEDRALSLRDHAIIMIGLDMGLRESDITAIKFDQIDWKLQCIRFCQQKTNVGKVLPMTVGVGNALYIYIKEGRPESKSRYVFITHKAPYKKISRHVCKRIMHKVFPDKNRQGYGFHITRRTFATDRFQNSCGFSEVSDLLGQTTTKTVHKYISIDEERMRLCPISLADAGILLKGGLRNG